MSDTTPNTAAQRGQFVGRHFYEANVIWVGHPYEQATNWHTRWPG
jgi:Asp-tRNA(Asn)/Glu-tRNA(Gln) amidotransferase A subunit family amidase